MTKSAPKVIPPVPHTGNRVHIRFLWRVLEFEGEGKTAVIGGLVIGIIFLGWLILRH